MSVQRRPLPPRPTQRGFALVTVLMIVALVALTGWALLRDVSIEQKVAKSYELQLQAQAAAKGAVLETMGQEDFIRALPPLDHRTHRSVLVRRMKVDDEYMYVLYPRGDDGQGMEIRDESWENNRAGGTYPEGTPRNESIGRPMEESQSPFVSDVGGTSESGYECEAQYLTVRQRRNSSQGFYEAAYDVSCLATVRGGRASARRTAGVTIPLNYEANRLGFPVGK